MRAANADTEATVNRSGIDLHYEVFGEGEPTIVMVPPAPITHSRIYKALVPYLARRNRVVLFDARGNGRSDRPPEVAAYHRLANASDIVAVLDAAGVERAVLVAHCHANWWAVEATSRNPDRVAGLVAMAPGVPYMAKPHVHWVEAAATWEDILDDPQGWALYNRQVITSDLRAWAEFFFSELLVEPHSTKQYEDAVEWALETTGAVLVAGEEAEALDVPDRAAVEEQCRALDVPTLVIHGDRDMCQNVARGRRFAELTGGDFMLMEGCGHLPLARDPVPVNHAIRGFVDRITRREP